MKFTNITGFPNEAFGDDDTYYVERLSSALADANAAVEDCRMDSSPTDTLTGNLIGWGVQIVCAGEIVFDTRTQIMTRNPADAMEKAVATAEAIAKTLHALNQY